MRAIDNPQHWYKRAAEMREIALKMDSLEATYLIIKLASDYERLAERAIDFKCRCRANDRKIQNY
jgi:hypothetical protein